MSNPVRIGDWCTLYHGDCREILPQIEVDTAAVLVTDPPYGIVESFGQNVGRGTRRLQFEWDDETTTPMVVEAMRMVLPVVNAFHTSCGPEQYGLIAEAARQSGLTPKPWAWVKKCPPPAGKGNWWPSGFELGMYGYRQGAWFGDENPKRCNVYRSDTYRHGIRAHEKTDHPTQRWLPMMEHLVASIVPPLGIAIDPFMGSGTTMVAAGTRGRRAIGIERDERYFAMAVDRIKRQTGDGPLFDGVAA